MATTRLRKIFKYDSDDDGTPWILDEEGGLSISGNKSVLILTDIRLEQEKVIKDIRLKDKELNEKFKVSWTTRMEDSDLIQESDSFLHFQFSAP